MSERFTFMAKLIFFRIVQTLELILGCLLTIGYFVCKLVQRLGSVRFTVYLAFPTVLTTLLAYIDAQICRASRMLHRAATRSVPTSSWADGKIAELRKQRQQQRHSSLANTLGKVMPADLAKEVLDFDIGYSRCTDDKDLKHNVTFMELFKASNRALFCVYH